MEKSVDFRLNGKVPPNLGKLNQKKYPISFGFGRQAVEKHVENVEYLNSFPYLKRIFNILIKIHKQIDGTAKFCENRLKKENNHEIRSTN